MSLLCSIDPTAQQVTSDLVTKLLQKDPDLRYQSASGSSHDVDEIKDGCDDNSLSSSNNAALSEHDFSTKLFVPQKVARARK